MYYYGEQRWICSLLQNNNNFFYSVVDVTLAATAICRISIYAMIGFYIMRPDLLSKPIFIGVFFPAIILLSY